MHKKCADFAPELDVQKTAALKSACAIRASTKLVQVVDTLVTTCKTIVVLFNAANRNLESEVGLSLIVNLP